MKNMVHLWEDLKSSIENLKNSIQSFTPPLIDSYAGELGQIDLNIIIAITDLQEKMGKCVGMAKGRYPDHSQTLTKLENDASFQFELLSGVERRPWRNYLNIVNVGLQKTSIIMEYVKTIESLIIPDIDDAIPEIISADYREALLCRSVEAYNASAVMCRRAIETVALLLGANERSLFENIRFLERQGLNHSLIEMATEIRLLGNVPAAHPDRSEPLRSVTPEECDFLLDFLREFLDSLYVRSTRIRELRRRRGNDQTSYLS